MKKWQRWAAIAAMGALGAAAPLQAQTYENSSRYPDDPDLLYHAKELTADIFGSASLPGRTLRHLSVDRIEDTARLGAGAGLNYFFSRHIGVGVDAYTENTEHSFVDSVQGHLIGRLPIGKTGLAPYIFGGGGRAFDLVEQWLGDAGGGLEFRFKQRWGLFIDARYTFPEKTDSYGVGRFGVRLSF
jgi:hypothetical protein